MTVRRASGTVKGMDRLHEILFSGSNGTIIRNIKTGDIVLSNVDGSNTITIADKNLGATAVYHYGDALSEANCGYYYQWGNNHGFPWEGSITTSSTQVDASAYGPGNYYDSDTYIIGNATWDSANNNNLWGDTTNTDEARQGPAPSGYHVPTQEELQNLWSLVQSITGGSTGNKLSEYCLLPFAGYRDYSDANVYGQSFIGYYCTSSPIYARARRLSFDSSYADFSYSFRAYGFSVRCFKNSYGS